MEDIKFIISKESKHICTIDGDTCIMVNNILLNNNDNSNNKTISLPKTINHKLKIFLNNTEILTENTIKDCYAFVAFLYNLNVTNRKIIFEEFTKINSSDLQVGDIAFIENLSNGFKQGYYHYALYIGEDKYISKFSNGSVGVSDLKSMLDLYNGTNITYLRKIN